MPESSPRIITLAARGIVTRNRHPVPCNRHPVCPQSSPAIITRRHESSPRDGRAQGRAGCPVPCPWSSGKGADGREGREGQRTERRAGRVERNGRAQGRRERSSGLVRRSSARRADGRDTGGRGRGAHGAERWPAVGVWYKGTPRGHERILNPVGSDSSFANGSQWRDGVKCPVCLAKVARARVAGRRSAWRLAWLR